MKLMVNGFSCQLFLCVDRGNNNRLLIYAATNKKSLLKSLANGVEFRKPLKPEHASSFKNLNISHKLTGLMEDLANEKIISQKLLTPLEMDLGVDSSRIVQEHLADFEALGFEIEAFGESAGRGSTFLVRAVPSGVERCEPEQLVREVIADVTEEWKQNHVKNVREFLLTYTACRGAIKFGDKPTMPEMEALVADMEKTKHSTHCPHGRPAIVKLTFDKLEEMLKRKNF